ncbi:MAG TPA: hypothetical protein VFG79_22685, partial [Solirubrobacter sp.]|nr:hypothetical protein [Solirubrobacter sp.]
MASPMLRPLSIGEILDAGIKVVLRNWKTFLACTAALIAPLALVYVIVLASIAPEQLELVPEQSTSADADLPEASAFVGIGLTYLVGALALLVSYGSCFKVVTDAWLGKRPVIRESLRFGLHRAWKLFLLGLVWFAFLAVAWIPCCVPLVWLGVMWCLSAPVLLVERVGPFKSMGRSYRLIQGRFWASLLVIVVCYLFGSILGGLLQLPLIVLAEAIAPENAWANGLAQGIGYTASFAISTPYLVAVLTILYFDQRVRKEGFDLQLMAEGLGVPRDPNAPVPEPLRAPAYTPEQQAAAPYWPPPPGWQPPSPTQPWSSQSGWTAPSPETQPLWGGQQPPAPAPSDPRPPDESPWMTPGGALPPGAGPAGPPGADAPGAPPPPSRGGDAPGSVPPPPPGGPGGSRPASGASSRDDDDERDDDPPAWPPRESPRGPG